MQIRVFDRECGIDDSRIDADAEVIRERVREYEAGERTTFDFEIDYLDGFTGDVMGGLVPVSYLNPRLRGWSRRRESGRHLRAFERGRGRDYG